MRWRRFLAFTLLAAACSPSTTPATTPATVATTAPTTTVAPTTTMDRLAEIEAIYQDLEERRLDALYRGDREAFRALYIDNGYLEENMESFDLAEFEAPPQIKIEVLRVIFDGPDCIAIDERAFRPELGLTSDPVTTVLEFSGGNWLISYVGSGWTCDGPHPFDS